MVTGVERPSCPIVLPYGEHDVSVRVLSLAHDLGEQLIADSEVGFGGDVGEDPRVSGRVELCVVRLGPRLGGARCMPRRAARRLW